MKNKILITGLVLFLLQFNVNAQDNLSLKNKIKYKKWYVIKIYSKLRHEVSYSDTFFSCEDDKPYLFTLTANNTTLRKNIDARNFKFPNELTTGNDVLYSYKFKTDTTSKKVELKVSNASEDFLEIEDEDGSRFFLISGPLNQN